MDTYSQEVRDAGTAIYHHCIQSGMTDAEALRISDQYMRERSQYQRRTCEQLALHRSGW